MASSACCTATPALMRSRALRSTWAGTSRSAASSPSASGTTTNCCAWCRKIACSWSPTPRTSHPCHIEDAATSRPMCRAPWSDWPPRAGWMLRPSPSAPWRTHDACSDWRSSGRALESAQAQHPHAPLTFAEDSAVPSQIVHTDQAPAAIGPYSQAVVANGLLYTAGQIALDPASGQVVAGDVVAQSEQVFRNLAAILGAVG